MNGKAAKLLRKMKRAKKADKRKFKTLPHTAKGKLRKIFVETGTVEPKLLPV